MKILVIILAMLVAPYVMYGATSHFIATNIYVVDDSVTYPMYSTQKMSKKFYGLMAEGDALFKNYPFDMIRSITVYIPNDATKSQTVVIGFKNKTVKTFDSNFFSFSAMSPMTSKIFSNEYIALLGQRNKGFVRVEGASFYTEVKY